MAKTFRQNKVLGLKLQKYRHHIFFYNASISNKHMRALYLRWENENCFFMMVRRVNS